MKIVWEVHQTKPPRVVLGVLGGWTGIPRLGTQTDHPQVKEGCLFRTPSPSDTLPPSRLMVFSSPFLDYLQTLGLKPVKRQNGEGRPLPVLSRLPIEPTPWLPCLSS